MKTYFAFSILIMALIIMIFIDDQTRAVKGFIYLLLISYIHVNLIKKDKPL